MAVCPFAVKKLIPPGSNDPRIKARAAIVHVADMLGPSLYEFFRDRSGGIESHFYIRLDGTLEQYRDTDYQADANLDANDFAISIETEGKAAGKWTDAQLVTLKRLFTWLHQVEDIPLRKIQHWDGAGIGYHTLFGAPSHWTPVAKSCPGPERKVQFDEVLVPWLNKQGSTPAARPVHKAAKTPNITKALDAKSRDQRKAALQAIVRNANDEAAKNARGWLSAILMLEEAEARANAALKALKRQEVR